jgi:phasin
MASAPKKPPVAPAPVSPVASDAVVSAPIAPVPLAAPLDAPAAVAVESVAGPALELQGAMQENLRRAAEKGVAETRVAFEKSRAAAQDAAQALEASAKSVAEGAQYFGDKLVDALRANADANFDFLKSLIAAKSASEAIALNSEHARKSFDALAAQSKDLSQAAQKVAADAFSPLRETLAKVFSRAA